MSSTDDDTMNTQTETRSSEKRPPRVRSCPDRGGPPSDTSSVGEVYFDFFGPPALASTADTYFQSYAVLRALLKGAPASHAYAVLDAAEDAAQQHAEQTIGEAGGGSRWLTTHRRPTTPRNRSQHRS